LTVNDLEKNAALQADTFRSEKLIKDIK